MKYSLWKNPWILAEGVDCSYKYSLLNVLGKAHEIHRLDQANPLIEVAVFRLLLAIVIDAMGHLKSNDWRNRWEQGCFNIDEIDRYARKVEDRFDLLDTSAPFYQVGGLSTPSGKTGSTLLLLPEIASGNNVPLFSSMTESSSPKLSLDEAVGRLLAIQAFDTAGIKTGATTDPQMKAGKTTGNPVGILGQIGTTIPYGRNLFESLMLNQPLKLNEDDLPVWRKPPPSASWETRRATGILDSLTWQSRRIRLVPDNEEDPQSIVGVIVAAGDRMQEINPAHEPHTAWRTTDMKRGAAPHKPIRHIPGKAAWRGMDSLLAVQDRSESAKTTAGALRDATTRIWEVDRTYPLNVRMAGVVYGNQSAVIEHTLADSIPLPVLALSETEEGQNIKADLLSLATMAEEVRRALNRLTDNLRMSYGGAAIPWDKGEHQGDRLIMAIDQLTRSFLTKVSRNVDELDHGFNQWQTQVRDVAWSIAEPMIIQVPSTAFNGRQKDNTSEYPLMNQARAEAVFRGELNRILLQAGKEETMKGDN